MPEEEYFGVVAGVNSALLEEYDKLNEAVVSLQFSVLLGYSKWYLLSYEEYIIVSSAPLTVHMQ
jgi:hypothetical protein